MKKIVFYISCLFIFSASAFASESAKYSIEIVDYSSSWTSVMRYHFSEDEILVEEIDNIDKTDKKTLAHRQLLGKERESIEMYLKIFVGINFGTDYVERSYAERNQKRLNIKYGEDEKSIFVSNKYQPDIANLIIFLNSFLSEKYKMKEFLDPTKPQKKKK